MAGLLILREQVLKPVLAGVCHPKRGRPPKIIHPLDQHYQKLQREMLDVETPYGPAQVKVGRRGDRVLHVSPEYDVCRRLAAVTGRSLAEIFEAAQRAGWEKVRHS